MQRISILRTAAAASMATALALSVAVPEARAAYGDPAAEPPTILSGQKTNVVMITLGTEDNRFVVKPEIVTLEKGKYYRLVIRNPSDTTHVFWAPEFSANATWTDTASVDKGSVFLRKTGAPGKQYSAWEIKVSPGGTATWEFVPEKAGLFKWGCSNVLHSAMGMHGEIIVQTSL